MPSLVGTDAASVIGELTQALHAEGVVSDSLAFYHAALNREFLAPTQVSSVIAFPHARSPVVSRLAFAVGRSAQPIAWGQGGDTVRLVFLIAIPPSSSGAYLNLMAALACLIRNPLLRNDLLRAADTAEIFHILEHIDPRTASVGRATVEIDN